MRTDEPAPARLDGAGGRADEAVKVKGMFLRPTMLAQMLALVPGGPARACLTITRHDERDVLTLEVEGPPDPAQEAALIQAVRDVTRLGCVVHWVAALPDGPPIRGRRTPVA